MSRHIVDKQTTFCNSTRFRTRKAFKLTQNWLKKPRQISKATNWGNESSDFKNNRKFRYLRSYGGGRLDNKTTKRPAVVVLQRSKRYGLYNASGPEPFKGCKTIARDRGC